MLEARSGKRVAVRLVVAAIAFAWALTACQSTVDPSAEALREAMEEGIDIAPAGFKPADDVRVRFLPPLGGPKPSGEFAFGALAEAIEVLTFALGEDGRATGGPIAPEPGREPSVTVSGDTFTLAWPATDPGLAERVRVEIRMAGADPDPVCDDREKSCLGFIDVRIVEKGGKGHGGGSSKGFVTVPSHQTLTAQFKLLAAESLDELVNLSLEGGLDPAAGNCPASEAALPSQGLQAIGAGLQAIGAGLQAIGAGGVTVFDTMEWEDSGIGTSQIAALFPGTYPGHFAKDVVLVVLDDFGGRFHLPLALTAGPLGNVTDELLAGLAEDGRVSHGALVFHEVVRLLQSLFGPGHWGWEPKLGGAPFVEFGGHYGPRLRVQAADARHDGALDTDTAAATLSDALDAARYRGFKRVVVNMSFAVVPCTVLDDFQRNLDGLGEDGTVTFDDYVRALLELNGVIGLSVEEQLKEGVHLPVDLSVGGDLGDRLFELVLCFTTGQGDCGIGDLSVTFVAASGNFGQSFALFPAALDGVVKVGSQPFRGGAFLTDRSEFSNFAGVMAPGDLVVLRTQGDLALAVRGTSYAAPVVSAFLALDQRKHSPVCGADELAVDPSGTPLPLLPGFAPTGGDALTALCGG